jgi:CRP/FNR family cyclic AMP-dependent transcriptional regulator
MNEQAISQCAIFTELSTDELEVVVEGGRQYPVPENHIFFEMGDSNESLFVVISGSVCIERPGTETDVVLATLESGAIFGEMSFMDSSKTTAQVTAVEPTAVLELNSTDFHRVLADRPALAAKLWRNLASEFRHRLAHTNELVDYYADLSQVLRDNPRAGSLLGT